MVDKKTSRRGPRAIAVDMRSGPVTVYAGAKVADALQELTEDMSLYHGVRLAQVLEAAYQQGTRDGRRQVFNELDKLKEQPALSHRNPGRPSKKKATTKKKATSKKATTKKKATSKKATTKKKATSKKAGAARLMR